MDLELSPQDLELGNYLAEYPMRHSVPLYFGNPANAESKINNGTGTLLKRGDRLFVATARHVLQKFLERRDSEAGIALQLGGLTVDSIDGRLLFDDEISDVAVLEFSDRPVDDFHMFGNVPTEFHELGDVDTSEQLTGKVVAFGGYPGAFRVQVATNEVNFHTFSSGASIVEEITARSIIVNINHEASNITTLGPQAPPAELGGMSGGPVYLISSNGSFTIFRFAGVISECSENFNVMFAKPIHLFAEALS